MIFTFVPVELTLFSNHAVNKNNILILGTIEPTYTWTCLKASYLDTRDYYYECMYMGLLKMFDKIVVVYQN